MDNEPIGDPEVEHCAAVERGEFATIEDARADFSAKLNRSLAQARAGQLIDSDVVFARLLDRYANWPRAAE